MWGRVCVNMCAWDSFNYAEENRWGRGTDFVGCCCANLAEQPKALPRTLGSFSLTKHSQVHLSRFISFGSRPMRESEGKKEPSSTWRRAQPVTLASTANSRKMLGCWQTLNSNSCRAISITRCCFNASVAEINWIKQSPTFAETSQSC